MKSLSYYIFGCLIISAAGGFGMLEISKANINLTQPVLPVALTDRNCFEIVHSVIAFSFAFTFLAVIISILHHVIRKRKEMKLRG